MTRVHKTLIHPLLTLLTLFVLLWPAAIRAQDTVFEIDVLNAGLGDRPSDMDLSTPQSAMEAFLFAARDEDYARAAHVLNLNVISEDLQPLAGPEMAEQLAEVIDRKVIVSWQQLLERPDSLDANAPSDATMAGQPRKSLRLAVLDLGDRPVSLRLNRVKPEGGDAVWVFSEQSVGVVPELHDAFGPSELEKALPDALRAEAFGGLFWWEVIVIPLVILAAGAAAVATYKGVDQLARKLGNRRLVRQVLKGLRTPLTLAVVSLVLWVATGTLFVVSGIVSGFVEPLIILLYVAAALVLAVNVIDAVLDHIVPLELEDLSSPDHEETRALATSVSAARRMVIVIALMAGAGIVLTTADVFQSLGFSFLAGAGALTLVLGFAGREALSNILASLQISLNRAARVGDQIIFKDHLCHVERIHFTFVQLKVWDSTRMIVPVSEFVSEAFVNRNLIDSGMTRAAILKVAPHTDVSAFRAHFQEWAKADDRIDAEADMACEVTGQGEFGLDIRCTVYVPDPRDGWGVECDMREEMAGWLVREGAQTGQDLAPHLGTEAHSAAEAQDAAEDQAEAA